MTDMLKKGLITKCIGGLYTVQCENSETIQCKARGIFRKDKVKPIAGDFVTVNEVNGSFAIISIDKRKNSLKRPPVANIDKLIIISAATAPEPNYLIIDRLAAIAENNNIEPVIVFSKCDLADVSSYVNTYTKSGFQSFGFSSVTGENTDLFEKIFSNSVCALTGNSGAGKTTLLNVLCPELSLDTGEISQKLGRGRHTTRCVELFKLFRGYIADTPGFSSLDIVSGDYIPKDELVYCFPDFAEYIGKCKFTSCTHTVEKGCAVLSALNSGQIERTRHQSYITMYNEVKDIKEWQLCKK